MTMPIESQKQRAITSGKDKKGVVGGEESDIVSTTIDYI